jgi:addiction module RelE/StbE family toxin
MDYRVVWSPEAIEDVESIATFIERDSPFYAKAVVTKIMQQARTLTSSAQRGRIVPELEDGAVRELFIYSYRLIYRIKDQTVLIVAVVHGKRQFDPFIDRIDSEQ